jgi:hypothetical protein
MSIYNPNKFDERRQKHDQKENEVMDRMRPFTNRRHLPDRWVAFHGMLCAWDLKTNVFVEKNSHDEYFHTFEHDGVPVFIVYSDGNQDLANWIQMLNWQGPFPPSPKSTTGDPYYRISGGIPLDEFLEQQRQDERDEQMNRRPEFGF